MVIFDRYLLFPQDLKYLLGIEAARKGIRESVGSKWGGVHWSRIKDYEYFNGHDNVTNSEEL